MLNRLDYPSPAAAAERMLLVMLPAAGAQAADFATNGFIADVQANGLAVDIAAIQPDLSLYLDGGIAAALHRQIVQPAKDQGYQRIWLMGISLGGMGALLYAAAHESAIAGLILLAPFLGTRGTIAALAKAGGIAGLQPGITTDAENILLGWLRDYVRSGRHAPPIYLGYGEDDRFAPGHRLLADVLPPERVVILPGGHDWECWRAAWRLLLARKPFDAKPFGALSGSA